jgi:pimeloyl-ACP methyl ester carboxylesterase
MLALLDALGIERAGVVGHDVGGAVMQPLARNAPDRIAELFFFDFVYPGIGSFAKRWRTWPRCVYRREPTIRSFCPPPDYHGSSRRSAR